MADIVTARRPFIDGSFVPGRGGALTVVDPAAVEPVAEVEGASVEQVEQAVAAARRAFDTGPWPRMSVAERAVALGRLADALDARRSVLVETVVAETGCPLVVTEPAQVGMALSSARELIDLAQRLPAWEHNEVPLSHQIAGGKVRLSIRMFEPVGVVGAITPYNFPFVTNVWKVIPALLAGCTVVLRPSPLTPLQALVFGEAAEEADLPAGVLNVIAEAGAAGGELLSRHPAVDLVTFTGSTTVGRAIAAQAAPTLKRLILELGGKSVQLHLEDALAGGPAGAVAGAMTVFAAHAGQACSAQTRMLVPAVHKATVLEALAAAAGSLTVGDPRLRTTVVGPLITEAHRSRVEAMVADGVAGGARVVTGGGRPPDLDRGWFYLPTVLDIDSNANPIAQREIFGPVLSVQGYDTIDEAVAIANDTEYGLSGAVYTGDLQQGLDIAARIRSGTVQVNAAMASGYTPMGGYKQSGIGRERGAPGIRAFQETKHVVVGGR